MSEKKQKIICGILLALSLAAFILSVFVFQKPDGTPGFLICLGSIYLIAGSIIRLCKLSERFKHNFFNAIELLFWLP
jgi:hypothetical protein